MTGKMPPMSKNFT